MATKVWYVLGTAAVSPAWNGNLQDGGTAPTDAACTFGYSPGKLAISSYCASRLGASAAGTTTGTTSNVAGKTGPTVGTGATNTTAGDSFSTTLPYTGTFASGNWTFVWNMRAGVAGLVGRLGMRVWASANASGTSARELTSGEIFSSSLTLSATVNTNHGITWAAPAVTLNNEYLFFQLEFQEQTSAGSSNTDTALFRVGSSITTTNFSVQQQVAANFASASTLAIVNPQTLVAGPITSGLGVWYPFDILATQWDPNFKQANDTVSGLSVTDPGSAVAGTTRATSSKSSGKWQFEVTFSGTTGWSNLGTGICQASHAANQWLSFDTVSWAYWATGAVYTNSASVDTVSTWALGDVIGVLVDLTVGKLWFLKNGAVIGGTNGGNPATGTGGYTIATGVAWYPGLVFNSAVTDSAAAKFGATALTYPVSGFTAWDTSTSDASGNNDAAILTGTTLPSLTTGKIGSGLSFNGNSVAFTSVSPLNQLLSNSFSVSAWVNTTATDGNILTLRNSTNGFPIIWLNVGGFNNTGTGKFGFTCRDDTGNFGIFNVNATSAINDGTWHHVCGTYNGPTATLSVYVDGALQNTGAFNQAVGLTFDTVWSAIGADPSGSNPSLVGSVDDFRFYNRLLSATEVNQIATQTEGFYTTGVGFYQFQSSLALLAGAGSLSAVGSGATRWQAVLNPWAGAGNFSVNEKQWLAAKSAFAGSSALTANIARLTMQWQGTGLFAGAGTFSINEDQWFAAGAALAGSSSLTAAGLVFKPLQSVFSGVGTANWPTIDPTDQLMAAYGTLSGSGSLTGDATRVPGAVATLWQAILDPWPGASTLAAQVAALLPGQAVFSGTGASASSLLTLRPVVATLSGTGTELAGLTARMPSAAALAGAGISASSLSQALSGTLALAGVGGVLGSLKQQLSAGIATLAGAGTLVGDAPALRIASAVLSGGSALNAASILQLTSSAVAAGTGLLTSAAVQQQNIALLASGAGALGSDVFVPGHNNWSAVLNPWPATGSLTAATTAWLGAGSAPWAAASTLAGSLTALAPIRATAAGVGQLAPITSSLQLATNASWSGASALAANYRQLLTITGSVLTGLGSLVGDVSRLTGGQIQQIDTVTYLGLSALTAQTAQWLTASATQLSGAGALTPSFASLFKPVTLSPAGQGLMAASAMQQMSMVSAAAGAGFLAGDVQRFVPGIQQGTAALAGAGNLLLIAQQLQATQAAFSAFSNLTAAAANRMATGAVWSGTAALTTALVQAFPLASLWAGQGLLGADIARLALVPGLSSQLAGFGSLAATTLRGLQAGLAVFPGAGSLAAKTTGVLATQGLLSSAGQLTTGLTAFEQIAGTLAAAGYSAAYLGEIQLLRQQILFGSGVLGANLIQTSIRVVSATIIGRPSESSGIIGRNPIAATVIGQDPRAGVIGQGDFVTLH